jgi:hypothetical protein
MGSTKAALESVALLSSASHGAGPMLSEESRAAALDLALALALGEAGSVGIGPTAGPSGAELSGASAAVQSLVLMAAAPFNGKIVSRALVPRLVAAVRGAALGGPLGGPLGQLHVVVHVLRLDAVALSSSSSSSSPPPPPLPSGPSLSSAPPPPPPLPPVGRCALALVLEELVTVAIGLIAPGPQVGGPEAAA